MQTPNQRPQPVLTDEAVEATLKEIFDTYGAVVWRKFLNIAQERTYWRNQHDEALRVANSAVKQATYAGELLNKSMAATDRATAQTDEVMQLSRQAAERLDFNPDDAENCPACAAIVTEPCVYHKGYNDGYVDAIRDVSNA